MDILFLAHRCPYPPDRGDRIRSWNVLRYLAARARVHLVALDEDMTAPPSELAAVLAGCTIVRRTRSRAGAAVAALASGRPVSLAAFDDPGVREAVAAVLREQPIGAIYAFSGQMAQYLPTGSSIPIIMDFVDVDSAKFAQLAPSAALPMRWLMRREARLIGAFERKVSRSVMASVFVSSAEADLFRAGGGEGRIVAVENGIDLDRYDPAGVVPRPGPPTIVFTGQMDYAPNADAVAWFARAVLPRIVAHHPAALFAVVGRAPTAAVRALAGEHVVVTGEVDDPRPWLAGAAVCVAPLRLARGIQNKVLEAMAMARAVVASPAAAEGIDHAGTIRVADGEAAFADAVVALLDDPTAAATLGAAARRQVEGRYDWPARLAPLAALSGLAA